MDDSKTKAMAVLALGIMAISWAAILVRLCHAPALVIAAYRLGLSAIFLAPLSLRPPWRERKALWKRNMGWILISGLCLSMHFFSWIEAVQGAPVVMAVTLSSTHPLMVGLFSSLIWRERFGGLKILGASLAVVGSAAMTWNGQIHVPQALTGHLWALAAAFFFSLYMIVGRRLRTSMALMTYVVPTYAAAAVFTLLAVAWKHLPLLGYPTETLMFFALLALVPTSIGHSSLNWALGHLSATIVALSALGEPIGASLLAWVILGEDVGAWKLFAALLILTGVYLGAKVDDAAGPDADLEKKGTTKS